MTEAQARTTANVILGIAAAGAAYYVLRTPRLRRLAFQLAGAALTGTVPSWLNAEVRKAWSGSGSTARRSQLAPVHDTPVPYRGVGVAG